MPFAEMAAESMPDNPSIQDTLGTVYIRLGQTEKADRSLSRALSLAGSADEAVAPLLHMAELRLAKGAKEEAGTYLRRAEELIRNQPALAGIYAELLKDLKAKRDVK